MPIPNVTLTGEQFDWLQRNLSLEADQFSVVDALAMSGLQYVVLLQVAAPEVDLVNPFNAHLGAIESTQSDSNFIPVATAMNMHVINRGTTQLPGETYSDRLNRWLGANGFDHSVGGTYWITHTYARISSGAGFVIRTAYIEP